MKIINYLILLTLIFSSLANAKSYVYITDHVDIPMRSSNKIEKNPSNLIRMLPSGTKLEILAIENSWTKVKFEKNVGWVVSRYLSNVPSARQRLEELKNINNANKLKIFKQQEENDNLVKQLQEIRLENSDLLIQNSKYKSEKTHIEKTYIDALKLEHVNEKLKIETLKLKTEIQLLKNNNLALEDFNSRNWFIVGAIVLFLGFMMGFLIRKKSNKRGF